MQQPRGGREELAGTQASPAVTSTWPWPAPVRFLHIQPFTSCTACRTQTRPLLFASPNLEPDFSIGLPRT